MPRRRTPTLEHDPLTLAATTWLACGIVLLGLTPLPWHDATLGWSPGFWLLAAPCLLLVARRTFAPRRAPEAVHDKTRPGRHASAVRPGGSNTAPARRRRHHPGRIAA